MAKPHSSAFPFLIVLACLGFAGAAAAQTGTIIGTVTNAETLQPLAGAQVFLPGLDRGTLSQANGGFLLINVPAGTHQVEVRLIGFGRATQQVRVTAGAQETLNIRLRGSAISLDEVIVTGVGVREERRRLGTASASMDAADLEARPVQSVTGALRGQIAGVMPSAPLGETGSGAPLRIRGQVSLTQRNQPLVFIDGVRQDGSMDELKNMMTSRLDDINPDDIERIEVIKGAAAATLFGTEASAGVIQIFTKRGIEGPARYSFSIDQGVSVIPMTDGDPRAGYVPPNVVYNPATQNFVTQHPMRDLLRTGHLQNYSLSVSGGVPDMNYFLSGRFMHDDGAPPNSLAKNISLRSKIDMNHGEKLRTEFGMNVIRNDVRTPTGGLSIGILGVATFANPLFADTAAGKPYGENLYAVGDALGGEAWGLIDRYSVDFKATYQWTPNLTSQAVIGYNRVDNNTSETIQLGDATLARGNTTGRRDLRESQRSLLTLDLNSAWQTRVAQAIGLQLWAGGQAFFEDAESRRMHVVDFPARGLTTIDAGATINQLGEGFSEVVNAGLFGQAQLDIRDRLFVTAGLRADANSAFGETVGVSLYPKVSGSYVLSDEQFWPGGASISLFRLRAAYGMSGLQPGAFDAVQTWVPRTRLGSAVLWAGAVGNPDLKPERSSELEMGADLGLLNDRIGLELTYYNQKTTDAIVPIQLAASSGFTSAQLRNVGEMETHGFEGMVNWNAVQRPAFDWSLTATAATVNQKVTALGGDVTAYRVSGGFRAESFVAVGHAPGTYRTQVLDESNPYRTTVPIEDVRSVKQIIANRLKTASGADSLVYHKAGVPTFTGTASSEFGLPGNVRLRALFSGAAGFSMFSQHDVITYQNGVRPDASRLIAELDDPSTSTERRKELAGEYARKANTVWGNWIEDGDYIRFQELSVSYRLPQTFASRLGLTNLSVSLAGQNLGLWSKYSGVGDPGLASQSTRSILVTDHRMHLPAARALSLSFQGGW